MKRSDTARLLRDLDEAIAAPDPFPFCGPDVSDVALREATPMADEDEWNEFYAEYAAGGSVGHYRPMFEALDSDEPIFRWLFFMHCRGAYTLDDQSVVDVVRFYPEVLDRGVEASQAHARAVYLESLARVEAGIPGWHRQGRKKKSIDRVPPPSHR